MSRKEIDITPIGEMLDMLSCLSVYEGSAKLKKPPMNFDEFLRLE